MNTTCASTCNMGVFRKVVRIKDLLRIHVQKKPQNLTVKKDIILSNHKSTSGPMNKYRTTLPRSSEQVYLQLFSPTTDVHINTITEHKFIYVDESEPSNRRVQ